MTQLDRLEALAEEWRTTESTDRAGIIEYQLFLSASDLIRVARAAKEVVDRWGEGEGSENEWDNATDALQAVLAPLFAEVES